MPQFARWESLARWTMILFVPISALGVALIGLSVHALPLGFMYVGIVFMWPAMALMAQFGGGPLQMLLGGVAQWIWCLFIVAMFRRMGSRLAAWYENQ